MTIIEFAQITHLHLVQKVKVYKNPLTNHFVSVKILIRAKHIPGIYLQLGKCLYKPP